MKSINFKESNSTYKGDGYKDLHSLKFEDGEVINCWKLSFIERIKVLFTGNIWHSQLTFNKPLQPIYLTVHKKNVIIKIKDNK